MDTCIRNEQRCEIWGGMLAPAGVRTLRRMLAAFAGVLAVSVFSPTPAVAADLCIQDQWAAHGNTQALTCTANDVRIASATNIRDVSGNPLTKCNVGETFSFIADFKVLLGAQARYDIGLYFATGGQPSAIKGSCDASIITPRSGLLGSANFTQLDGAPDTCGDIDAGHNPQLVGVQVDNVICQDTDGDGKLNLPNCTSWRQPGSNQVCNTVADAFPGSPSKCNCDNAFNVDIFVEQPTITVTKAANPTSLNEPGGQVTYTVGVKNDGVQASVTITSLTEDDNNDGTVDITYTSTSSPPLSCGAYTLAPGASTTCTFTRNVTGNPGDNITDKACVGGTNSNGGTVQPTCATATVSIKDVVPTAAVTKTVNKLVCAVVQYDVKVENTDLVEALTLSSLVDAPFGDITTKQGDISSTTCAVPQTIAIGGNYQCSFNAVSCSFPATDTVTATLNDNDGNTITKTGKATVNVGIIPNP